MLCNEFGFQEVRRFTTFIFSRLKPKTQSAPSVFKIRYEEIPEVKRLLLTKYSDFNMVSIDELFENDSYYVVKDDNGKILAGAHVSPTHWHIFKMHNKVNTLLVSILSRVPLLNRLVNKDFRFLAVDGLYFTEGHEHYTEALLSSLLSKYNHNNALIPADNDSSLFRHLQELDLGFVSKISRQVSVSAIGRFNNFSSEEIQKEWTDFIHPFRTVPNELVNGID